MRIIKIIMGDKHWDAELDGSSTADRIWDALPIQSRVSVWGAEIYFSIPVNLEEAPDAQAEVDVGTLAYWPPGSAFCIFFGPTPVSESEKPKAYSPVNVFGSILGDVTGLRSVRNGATVLVEKA